MSRIEAAIAILDARAELAVGKVRNQRTARHYSRIMRAYRRTVAIAMGIGSVAS